MSESQEQKPDGEPAAGESIPPVESGSEESGDRVEEVAALGPEDVELVSDALRAKTAGKVDEICDSLGRICETGGPQEIEGSRYFTQDLQGRMRGYKLIVDVRVSVRKGA